MKIIATYFLKALYQLQTKHLDMYMFSDEDIRAQMMEIVPAVYKDTAENDLKVLFLDILNPVTLNFCKKVISQDIVHYMPDFEVGINSMDNDITLNSATEKDTQRYFGLYCPLAYDDYIATRNLFLSRDIVMETAGSLFNEKKIENGISNATPALQIFPQFQIKTLNANSGILVEAQEINKLQDLLEENTSIDIRLEQVLKAICEIVLLEKNNVYDYDGLLKNIFVLQRFAEEQKPQAISIITKLNKQLLQLGYCYEYSGHAIYANNLVPAKFAIRYDKKFVPENFSQDVENLQQLYMMTIQELQNSFNAAQLLTSNNQIPQIEFYDYKTIQQRVDHFVKQSYQQTNTLIFTVLASLMMKEPCDRFAAKDILKGIDNSFDFVKSLPLFKSFYLSMMQKLLSCPYIFSKRNTEIQCFIPNVDKQFNSADFSDVDSRQLYDQVMEGYKAFSFKSARLEKAMHAIFVYAVRMNRLFIVKDDIQTILIDYGIIANQTANNLNPILEEILARLCAEGVFAEKDNLYSFQFNPKVSTFITSVSLGLVDYYHQLATFYTAFVKRAQQQMKNQHSQEIPFSTGIQQFGNPIVQQDLKRKLDVVDLEEDNNNTQRKKTG